jgi:hypothetical protein
MSNDNQFEQGGVTSSDRGAEQAAEQSDTQSPPKKPAVEGDQRRMEQDAVGEAPEQREVENPEADAAVPGAGAAEEGWSGSFPPPSDARSAGKADEEPATPPAPEPSHQAVGVGVVDDGTTTPATPAGQSQSGQDGPTYGGQAAGAHMGQDGGRETMSASQAQRQGALGTEQEQRLPAMSQNNASDVDKVAGIVAQTRQDLGPDNPERAFEVLKQRLSQSGIDLPDSDIRELARQITTGDD